MQAMPQQFFPENKQRQKGRFQKKGKHSFHSQSLPYNTACKFRKFCPISAELKFHRNARNHAHSKIQGKNAHPKMRCIIVFPVITL